MMAQMPCAELAKLCSYCLYQSAADVPATDLGGQADCLMCGVVLVLSALGGVAQPQAKPACFGHAPASAHLNTLAVPLAADALAAGHGHYCFSQAPARSEQESAAIAPETELVEAQHAQHLGMNLFGCYCSQPTKEDLHSTKALPDRCAAALASC